jgi:hypothetical protein
VAPHDTSIGLSDFALVCQAFRLVLHEPCQAGNVFRSRIILRNRVATGEGR